MKKHHKIYTAAAIAALLMGTVVAVPQTIIPKSTLTASAATTIQETLGGVTYEFDSNEKKAMIVGIDSSKESFITPDTITFSNITYTVNSFDAYSLTNHPNIKSLTIGKNIKSVGHMAFGNCSKLETVTIKGNPSFEPLAFDRCRALKNVNLSGSITVISTQMFSECESLKSITLPTKLTAIDSFAFNKCRSLTSISIPDNVQTISALAFKNCTSLASVKLPSKLKTIEESAFMDCTSLKMPIFPSTLTSIGNNAFRNTTAMTGAFVIPNNINKIGKWAFENSGLTQVVSNGASDINNGAFSNMPKLRKVTLTGKEKLHEQVFANSQNFSNLVVNFSEANDWHYSAFENCSSLQYINDKKVQYSYDRNKDDVFFYGSDLDAFVREKFNAVEHVGFIESYVDYYSEQIVSRYTNSAMTDQEKAKALHDWVAKKVNYDHDNPSNPKNHRESSLFINSKTVCQGYALGYNKLLTKAGLESSVKGNLSHVWNKCKFGDLYFNIDACWDDSAGTTTASYKWFMLTDKEVLEQEASSHQFARSSPYSDIPMGDINMDKVVDEADIELLNKHVSSGSNFNKTQALLADLDFNGIINDKDMDILKNKYKKRFDLNGNGGVTNLDHALLQFTIVKQINLSKEQTEKADNNNDGKIDAQDAKEMRYYIEKYTGQSSDSYYRLGDLNLDGIMNNNDVTALYNYVRSNIPFEANKRFADLNNDGKVDSTDLNKLNDLLQYKMGDLNFDGKVNDLDHDLMLNHLVHNIVLPDKALWYADINGDGTIDIRDAVKMNIYWDK